MSLGGKWTSDRAKLNSSAIIRKVPIKDACVGKLAPSSHSDKVDIFNFLQGLLILIRKPVGVLKCAINSNWSQRFPERIGLSEPQCNWCRPNFFVLIKWQCTFKFCVWAKLLTHETWFIEGGWKKKSETSYFLTYFQIFSWKIPKGWFGSISQCLFNVSRLPYCRYLYLILKYNVFLKRASFEQKHLYVFYTVFFNSVDIRQSAGLWH